MMQRRSLSVFILLQALVLAGPADAAPPLDVALEHLARNHDRLGLTLDDLADKQVTDQYRSVHNGVTHIYFRQQLRGLKVANAALNVNVGAQGDVVNVGNRFVRGLAAKANRSAPVLDAGAAVAAAAQALGLAPPKGLQALENARGVSRAQRFSGAGVSLDDIPVELAYYATAGDTVRLAWEMVVREPGGDHWWNLWIDAETGELLGKADWIANDTYQVFAYPQESPDDGPRTIQADPADSVASLFGWHDTNGIAGPEFLDTRGNNVIAQEDRDGNDIGGFRPSGGSTLDFLSPLDLATQSPSSYQAAAVTNLFYWNNVLHDLLYQYGFNERAGNFQTNNYGRGGTPNDPVIADAQDGSGTDNANFATPPDGSSPRMQMFEWTSPKYEVVVAGARYVAAPALFGPSLNATGVSGPFVVAQDATASFTDGCEPLTNAAHVSGGVALIDRGTCTFVTKVKNAQNAGAIAVVIVNQTDDVVTMGGTDGTIHIPSLMIGKSAGDAIRNALPVSGTLRLAPNPPPNRDSDLDAGVIAHEYCHGLSLRLTGGPSTTSCLIGDQQAGEGWSDLCTLFFTASPTDTATTSRGVGNYLMFQPATGPGIRPYPYTVDMNVNPLTYGALRTAGQSGGLTIPHGVGTVWATAVWEMYWNLVGQYGFSTDFYAGNAGNNKAIQLVIDGLKLQPCFPTFLDARDAILAADQADYAGANRCLIWQAFAKRGMGLNADDGGSVLSLSVTEDFTVPANCVPANICGNGVCESTNQETCTTCADDCPSGTASGAMCGNGLCEAGDGEDCASCPQDCNGKLNGKPSGRFCCGASDGAGTVACGDSRCSQNGWSCTNTPAPPGDSYCCGNGICENGETCGTCPTDCAAVTEVCSGGADEDCDGLVDCADSDCSALPECQVPVCTLGTPGDPCIGNQDCCSGSCKGKPGQKTCR